MPTVCEDVPRIYTNEVTPVNTWITGVTDYLFDGKIVSWETIDEVNKGLYSVTIKG